MRTKTWKLAILSLVAAAAFTSCDNDDDYYYVAGGDAWLSYGNLEAIDNGGYSKYAIRRDDGSRLIINDGIALRSEDAKEGMRVYTHYGILASERDDSSLDGGMNYYIRLYGRITAAVQNLPRFYLLNCEIIHIAIITRSWLFFGVSYATMKKSLSKEVHGVRSYD